jgi:hypothetical protein
MNQLRGVFTVYLATVVCGTLYFIAVGLLGR